MNASSNSRSTPNSPESGQAVAPVNDCASPDRSSLSTNPSTLTTKVAPPKVASLPSSSGLEPSGPVAQDMAQAESMPIAPVHPSQPNRRLQKILALTAGMAAAAGLGGGLALRYAIGTGSVPAVLRSEQTFPPQADWLQPESPVPVVTPVPIVPVPPVIYEAPVPTAPERQTAPPPPTQSPTPLPLPTLPSPDVYPTTSDPLAPSSPEPVTAPSPAPIAPPDSSQPIEPDSELPTPDPGLAPAPSPTP